jgi:hypothetical protein
VIVNACGDEVRVSPPCARVAGMVDAVAEVAVHRQPDPIAPALASGLRWPVPEDPLPAPHFPSPHKMSISLAGVSSSRHGLGWQRE